MTDSAHREFVEVPLSERRYRIKIGSGNLQHAGAWLRELAEPVHAVVVSDEQVAKFYLPPLVESLQAESIRVSQLKVPAGEATKSVARLEEIWQQLLEEGTDRASVLIALGGGVVGDLAGFAAASYARGIRFFQIPTTLLAQVDSSVGGKTGINLPGAKNMVGAFWQPIGVLIDTEFLRTLSPREYRAGLAEVVKYGVILDAEFFAELEQEAEAIQARQPQMLRQIIRRCCELKAEVVIADERETSGRRAILNFGHTFAHGFEAVAGYGTILHGEAVAIGMLCATKLAEDLHWIPAEVTQRLERLLRKLELPTRVPDVDLDEVLIAMQRDKKVQRGKLRYILPHRIGEVAFADDVTQNQALQAMRAWS